MHVKSSSNKSPAGDVTLHMWILISRSARYRGVNELVPVAPPAALCCFLSEEIGLVLKMENRPEGANGG